MALKKMRVSFDIDMPMLVQMLIAGHSEIKIDMYGDEQKPPRGLKQLVNGHANGHDANHRHAPKLLEAPKKQRADGERRVRPSGGPTIYGTVLDFLVAHRERKVSTKELVPVVVGIGAAPNSVSPQLTFMRQKGFVKGAKGLYRITARGVAFHQKKKSEAAKG